MNNLINEVIKKTYSSNDLYIALDEVSSECPFVGGCLVCAKSIIEFAGKGSLVRMVSDINGGQTEHYGAMVDGVIYDFDGSASSPQDWIERFQREEGVNRDMTFQEGYDENSDIPDDPVVVKAITKLMFSFAKN